jgi:methyl-accepting chemotaxis protein
LLNERECVLNLLNHLRVKQKLLVLGVIALMAVLVPSALFTRDLVQTLAVSNRSGSSAPVLGAFLEVLRHTQAHRGLSAGVLAGNDGMVGQWKERRQKVDAALTELSTTMAATQADQASQRALSQVQAEWGPLADQVHGKAIKGPDSFARHTQLIAKQMVLLDLLLDTYGLTLDPNADMYFLTQAMLGHLTWATEYLGQMRALGNGALVAGQLPEQNRLRLAVLLDNARERLQQTDVQASKALAANAVFSQKLKDPVAQAMAAGDKPMQLVRTELLEKTVFSYEPAAYFRETTVAIDSLFAVIDASMAQVRQQLEANVARAQWMLWGSAGALLGVVLLLLVLAQAIARSITQPLAQAVDLAHAVASGDLTRRVQVQGNNELAQLMKALAQMQTWLAQVVGQVRDNAQSLAAASGQIAMGTQDLSRRTESEASALEQTSASMQELGETVAQNTLHVGQANQAASHAASVATEAGDAVAKFVNTMEDIQRGSQRIGEIIGVIDGIAFQTNILALNAAVEAARAGEQGRGFAVVASEVRSLAQRSAEAARQIKGLITESVDQVSAGTQQVESTRDTMRAVVASIQEVSHLMSLVTSASDEQRSGIDQVVQAVTQLDQTTQQNAALVEESAAATTAMSQQAEELARAVSRFKLEASSGPSLGYRA